VGSAARLDCRIPETEHRRNRFSLDWCALFSQRSFERARWQRQFNTEGGLDPAVNLLLWFPIEAIELQRGKLSRGETALKQAASVTEPIYLLVDEVAGYNNVAL
jgi:hypothetical protein